ncbi:hypothetical protein [Archaeoglobus neptunius]|uniref:hypothetical protein n=1 Tax=Archaeoglobus neptunius TaxID=2798580 RepID=UPI00192699AE|nr:hypothetical protein [Archaeoglobus neptunius]
MLVSISWIIVGFIPPLANKSRSIEILSLAVLLTPLALLLLKVLPALAAECTLNLQTNSQFAVKLAALIFTSLLAIFVVLRVFGYDLSVKSLRELSERRRAAMKEGSYSILKDPIIWITWVILTSTGLLIALFMGLIR